MEHHAPHAAGVPQVGPWGQAGCRLEDGEAHHAHHERDPWEAGLRERGLRERVPRGDRREPREPHEAAQQGVAQSEPGPQDLQ